MANDSGLWFDERQAILVSSRLLITLWKAFPHHGKLYGSDLDFLPGSCQTTNIAICYRMVFLSTSWIGSLHVSLNKHDHVTLLWTTTTNIINIYNGWYQWCFCQRFKTANRETKHIQQTIAAVINNYEQQTTNHPWEKRYQNHPTMDLSWTTGHKHTIQKVTFNDNWHRSLLFST